MGINALIGNRNRHSKKQPKDEVVVFPQLIELPEFSNQCPANCLFAMILRAKILTQFKEPITASSCCSHTDVFYLVDKLLCLFFS